MPFRLAPLIDCQDRLKRDYIEFAHGWAEVQQDWLDHRCHQFEQDHLVTLGPSLSRLSAALNEFSDAVRQAEASLQDKNAPTISDFGAREGLE